MEVVKLTVSLCPLPGCRVRLLRPLPAPGRQGNWTRPQRGTEYLPFNRCERANIKTRKGSDERKWKP